MRVTYLFDPPAAEIDDLTGLQADGLASRGHTVRIVAFEKPALIRGGRRAEWIEVDDWREVDTADDDVVVATSVRTARLAAAHRTKGVFQLCQTLDAEVAAVPLIVAGQASVNRFSAEGRSVFDAGLVVDEDFYRSGIGRENEPLRVLVAGSSQTESKGVDDGYGAVAHARWFHQTIELVRTSLWAPSREEPLDTVQEFHVGLTSEEARRLMHSCDVAIVPGHADEAFSLVAAEAMAAGLACVLTATPAHRLLAEPADYALFAPEQNAVELGERLIEVLTDDELRERLRRRGREVAEHWRPERAAERLEAILLS